MVQLIKIGKNKVVHQVNNKTETKNPSVQAPLYYEEVNTAEPGQPAQIEEVLTISMPNLVQTFEDVVIEGQAATEATATLDGTIGLVVLAADNDETGRKKAVTPAGLQARMTARLDVGVPVVCSSAAGSAGTSNNFSRRDHRHQISYCSYCTYCSASPPAHDSHCTI